MAEMQKPVLETPRLRLRPMRVTDLQDLLVIFADPIVMAAFDTDPCDEPEMARWLQRNLDYQAEHGYGLFSVIHKSSELLIGDCGLEWLHVDGTSVAELGYDFRSDFWRQGFATEAAAAVRDYAFNLLRLPRLISLLRLGNQASERVAERIGMQRISEFSRFGILYWKFGLEREVHAGR